ncbi:MAG: hypothetical protein IJY22_08270 [Clostridia bacterium]|nr:hypothetical protein [Clostridia bacterium]
MKTRKLGKLLLVALFAVLFAALLVVQVGAEEAEVTNEAVLITADNQSTAYGTVAEAVAAAKDGDTIELIGANTIGATITIDKNLTITGAEGSTVTASGVSLFNVKNGAKLTLGGYTAWSTNKSCISVGEGGAHVVLTDAVQLTSIGNDTQGAIFSDYTGNDDSTLEILATTVGAPKLTTTLGWAIDYQDASSTTTGRNNYSGVKTVKIIGAIFNTEYAIVYNNGGITPNVYVEDAEFTAVQCILYLNNCYFETDDGINGNGNVGNYVFKNVTVHSCKEVFGTATTDCRANIEIIGGSYTSSGYIFNIDKTASVVNVTINGGNYTSGNFALFFNTTSLEALLTITGEAKFTGNWFLVSDGLLRTDIAWDAITVETTNANDGIFASARVKNADGTVTYGSIANVVAYAPAGSVIDIDGVPTISNVQIDKDLTITGIGTITAASGQSLFTVKNGAKVTFSGSTVWNYNAKGIVIGEGGGHVVITDTVKFTTTSGSQNGAVFYDERPDVNSTIEILKSTKGAPTLESKGWTIDFEGDDSNPYKTTKKINITGGTFSGSHPIVFNVGGVTADVSVTGGSFTAGNEVVYINNNYYATAGADGKGNVGTFVLENIIVPNCNHFIYFTNKGAHVNMTVNACTVTAKAEIIFMNDKSAHVANIKMEGGSYTTTGTTITMNAGNTLNLDVNTAKNCTATTTFTDGSQFLNSGSSFGTFNIKNTTISSANRAVSIHYAGQYDLTFTDCTVSAGERVYAFHDTSKCSLTLHGGTHTLTNTNINGRFGIYISGTDSLLNLTVDQKAKVISNNPYDNGNTGTIFTNGTGAKIVGSFKNAYVRGAYVFRAGSGTMDLTLEDTIVEVIGTGAGNYNGTASAFFLAGTTEQHKVHLKKGTVVRPMDDDTLNPNGVMNGFNIRENVSFDITFEKDVEILANGFCFKNNTGRCLDSKLTINGGTYTAGGTNQVIAFYGRTTDDTKPTTLVINGGTFSAEGGHALQFFSDKGLVVGYINGGTFTSNSGTTIYAHANRVKDGETVVSEGQSVLNIYNCVCITGTNDAALYASGDTNDLTDGVESIVNVYGGYFEGHNLCAARASSGGVLNVYGGTFRFENKDAGHWGAPIRSGTGSNVGTVHIYGGNFYTTATANAGLFTCMNANSFLTVHGGFNGIGGLMVTERFMYDKDGESVRNNSACTPHAIGTQVASNSIYMIDGAAVRLVNGSNGLRFKSVVSAEAMAYINSIADADSVKFGTLIAPADFLEDAYTFTAAELDRLGLKYIDLVAEDGLTVNEDGSYTICAAITNIKEENIDRNFAATSYVEYTVNGNTVRVYSNYRELKNTRSIAQVARIALSFGNRYTAAQREVLELYAPDEAAPVIDLYLIAGQSNGAGCSNFSADFKNSDPNFTNGYSNVLYHGVSVGGSAFAGKRIYTNVPVKAGYGCGTSDIGPELGMAKALSQYYNEETGRMAAIVKYAYGGTGLADTISGQNFPEGSWCPPSWLAEHGKVDEYKSGGLYRALVMQIQSAVSDYRALGYDVNIIGGYWMQGENDRTKDPNTYAAMFECWLTDLRNDVYAITRDEADLSLPMAVGEISDYFNYNNYESNKLFTQMQREQIGALENVYVINNSTLPTLDHSDDKAHWDSHSALWIGEKVGITYLTEVLGSKYVVSDEDLVAEVLLGGEVIGRYDSLVGAINEAPEGAVIDLKKDLTLYSTLAIGNRNQITLNGNDHKIDFVLPTSTNHTSMIMWYATDMTVNDLHISHNNQAWGTQLRQEAKVTWNRGSITATQFCFVINTTGELTLNDGDYAVTNSEHVDAAIVYVGNNKTTVTINSGTFTTDDNAVGVHVRDQALVVVNGGEWTCGGNYIFELVGANSILALDEANTTLNEGYKIAPIYNAGHGPVEDDGEGDIFG